MWRTGHSDKLMIFDEGISTFPSLYWLWIETASRLRYTRAEDVKKPDHFCDQALCGQQSCVESVDLEVAAEKVEALFASVWNHVIDTAVVVWHFIPAIVDRVTNRVAFFLW